MDQVKMCFKRGEERRIEGKVKKREVLILSEA